MPLLVHCMQTSGGAQRNFIDISKGRPKWPPLLLEQTYCLSP